MVYYYLDLEVYSTGKKPDVKKDKIITSFVCAFDEKTGKPLQTPTVIKEWDVGEERIVDALAQRFSVPPFDFILAGFNVLFDLWFLKGKIKKYTGEDIGDQLYLSWPHVDLKQVMVFHSGTFKGTRIGTEGNPIKDWYAYKDFESIERHVHEKFVRFCEEWKHLKTQLPAQSS